jgi:hypothetical protein
MPISKCLLQGKEVKMLTPLISLGVAGYFVLNIFMTFVNICELMSIKKRISYKQLILLTLYPLLGCVIVIVSLLHLTFFPKRVYHE